MKGLWTALAVGLLIACGPAQEESSPDGTDQPQSGGTLTVALSAEPPVLNPIMVQHRATTLTLATMHHGLVRKQPNGDWGPGLAERWEVSGDGKTLTAHLQNGVRWSDGDPFDAADVVHTFDLVRDEASPFTHRELVDAITAVTALDDHTVEFVFAEAPDDPLLHVVVNPLPSHLTSALDLSQVESWELNRAPVTVGAFRLAGWSAGESLTLERNPHYGGRAAYFDQVVFRVVPDPSVQLLQLTTGEVDVVEQVPFSEVDRLKSNADVQLHAIQGRRFITMIHNVRRPALADARVRKAISLAIDRQAIVDGLMYGFADPAASALPPILWAHHATLEADRPDIARANALLDDAGWALSEDGVRYKGDQPLSFQLLTRAGDPVREGIGTRVQQELGAVGFRVEVSALDGAGQFGRMKAGDYDSSIMQAQAPLTVDPGVFWGPGGGLNIGGYDDPDLNALIAQGHAAADRAAALPIWHRVQEMANEQQPWTMLVYPHSVAAIRTEIRGAEPNYLSHLFEIENWWRAE